MIYIKTDTEIELMRQSAQLVSKTLAEVAKLVKPGVTTLQLDSCAEAFIRDHKAVPGFLGYGGFPNTLCTSVNDEVVHGIPSNRILRDGDIVSVDCGVIMNEFYGDSAFTFTVGEVVPEIKELLRITRESLEFGIKNAVRGNRLGDISYHIQKHCETNKFSVVREMVGHGIGRKLHESPEVPNYGKRGSGALLKKNMVLAIEPMINFGKREISMDSDGWTIRTRDKSFSAHFEHTVVVGEFKADVLSSFDIIEQEIS